MPHRYRVSKLPGQGETESKKEKNRRKGASQELKRRQETAARPGQKPNENYMHHPSFTLPIERMSRRGPLPSYHRPLAERPKGTGHGKQAGPSVTPPSKSERETLRFFHSPVFRQPLRGSDREPPKTTRTGKPRPPTPPKAAKPPKPPKPPRVGNRGPRSPEIMAQRAAHMQETMRLRRESEQRRQERMRGPFFPLGGRAVPDAESERYMHSAEFDRPLDGPLGPLNDRGH